MEKLIILGTGNANVTRCYNTCFILQNDEDMLLVDAGGGNGILRQLEDVHVDLTRIHNIYLTHEHTDHLLGMIWMIRMIAAKMRADKYEGDLNIYCHADLIGALRTICGLTLQKKMTWLFDHRIFFIPVYDGDIRHILDYDIQFFDIRSTKAKQFGFSLMLKSGQRLTCMGDEPINEGLIPYVKGTDWLMHESFCLYSQRETYKPYEKHHSTVREASQLAEQLGCAHLILYHTEDDNIARRKELYTAEGRLYYHGDLRVPDDLEEIILSE